MKKLIWVSLVFLFMVTCKKSSGDDQSAMNIPTPKDSVLTYASLIGKWKLSAIQDDGGSGDVSWHPVDTTISYAIFSSDTLIFLTSIENDTDLYKITQPGIFYLYRSTDSFRLWYTATTDTLTFSNANCSEACAQKYYRLK